MPRPPGGGRKGGGAPGPPGGMLKGGGGIPAACCVSGGSGQLGGWKRTWESEGGWGEALAGHGWRTAVGV